MFKDLIKDYINTWKCYEYDSFFYRIYRVTRAEYMWRVHKIDVVTYECGGG